MIPCPQCHVSMKEAVVRANPGSLIQLDQCPRCGGVWCDQWELFPIDPDEAIRLDAVDEKLLSAPAKAVAETLTCPRCTGKLKVLDDPILPKEIILRRCRRCDGIWLKRGQLRRYKNYQKATRQKNLSADAVARRLPASLTDPKSWVVTGTQGMFA